MQNIEYVWLEISDKTNFSAEAALWVQLVIFGGLPKWR